MGEFQDFYTHDNGEGAPTKRTTASVEFREGSHLPRSNMRDPVAGPSRAPRSREHAGAFHDPRTRERNADAGPSHALRSPSSRARDHYQGHHDSDNEFN
ncbi:hypothetical protein Hypma_014607 [Hypsizygus marmoreus]|uniref:Uncharacterized protein n=1 Tax=Hypsizygus marmoreus TaxID=39966 RepID=A0A369JH84_HYPMA|nr:hypothetical protein Hypma_014607 [Hypsizygus marmoreus]